MKLRTLVLEVSAAVGSGAESCRLLRADLDKRLSAELERSAVARENSISAIAGFRSAVNRTLDEADEHLRRYLNESDRSLETMADFLREELSRVIETLDRVRGEHLDGGAEPQGGPPMPSADLPGAVAAALDEAATAPPDRPQTPIKGKQP